VLSKLLIVERPASPPGHPPAGYASMASSRCHADTPLQSSEALGFVSGHRFSDAENPLKSVDPFTGWGSEV
jgi:hypothetical protein